MFWVAGGSTANLLAVWRLHGLDVLLRDALERGAVLCGVSAGMNCWFEGSTTDSFGPTLAPLRDGLGFLAGSCLSALRLRTSSGGRSTGALVDRGELAPGYAADDYAALHFRGAEFAEAVALREGAQGYRVEPGTRDRRYPLGIL